MGDVVEFPRKLEWQTVEAWIGRVPNTRLIAKVESTLVAGSFSWFAWNGTVLVAMGSASSLKEGQDAAKRAFEDGTLVVRTF